MPYPSDSLTKTQILNTAEKVYLRLLELSPSKDYLIGLHQVKTNLKKPFNYDLLNQISDADDLLYILNYIFNGISYNKSIPENDLLSCKASVERIVDMNISEDNLWTLTYSMFRWKNYDENTLGKTYSNYLEILLKRLLTINPNSAAYLFSNYELQIDNGQNADFNSLLNQNSQQNLELFSKFFSEGFREYIFTNYDANPSKYDETYLINATKIYEKLIGLYPENKEYTHDYSEVYYKLCWFYLIKNQNTKALESALKINKIEVNNDDGIMATIFAYLFNNQSSKAYKITDKYKGKICSTKVPYWDYFKYEASSLLAYVPENAELKKYLEYLKK